jgi:hypothetical protein
VRATAANGTGYGAFVLTKDAFEMIANAYVWPISGIIAMASRD